MSPGLESGGEGSAAFDGGGFGASEAVAASALDAPASALAAVAPSGLVLSSYLAADAMQCATREVFLLFSVNHLNCS